LGVDAENHAMEIRLLAARRMGELVPVEQGKRTDLETSPKLGEVKIPQQRLSEFRKLAEIPITEFKEKIEIIKERGERINYNRLIHDAWIPTLYSKGFDWWTPKKYIEAVHRVMGGIDLDPASCEEANKTVQAKKYYNIKSNGLLKKWEGRIFLNPPYSNIAMEFIEKFFNDFESTFNEGIILVNSRATDADWFQPMFEGTICFTNHRIDFGSSNERPVGSTHGSCFIYFGPNEKEFAEIFSEFGNIVKRWPGG
jgi:phage N-6-adenine-methyltransferase